MGSAIRILFLADLHYTEKNLLNRDEYIESLCESVNKSSEGFPIDILVIAGDICDRGGSEQDYEKVSNVINTIMEKVGTDKAVLVPGNHDVSRNVLLGLSGEAGRDKKNMWKYAEKYKYFQKIKQVKYLSIDIEKVIVSHELIKDKYLILGLNSTYKIGIEDGVGYVDVDKLETEFADLQSLYGDEYSKLLKIVVMHHYPHHYISHLEKGENNNKLEEGIIGNYDLENWEKVKKLFQKYTVKVVLTGHIHGSQIRSFSDCEDGEQEIYYSAIGSIGMNFNYELEDILKYVNEREMTEDQVEKYQEFLEWIRSDRVLLSISNHHNTYGIITINEQKIEEQHYKYLADEGVTKWIPWYTPLKSKRLIKYTEEGKNPFDSQEVKTKEKIEASHEETIIDIIRQEHLYKTGHFHWKDQCVMNWIDTTVLLTKSRYLNLISSFIVSKFSSIIEDAEYVLGLGIKGAILMSSIRYKYPGKRFSYYPEDEINYNQFEKCVLSSQNMDRIIVLTDVVHSGGTVIRFVEKNQNLIADNSTVKVISIFSTGETKEGDTIIKKRDKNPTINIYYHYLVKIPVQNCGKNSQNCRVRKEKLDIVYEM